MEEVCVVIRGRRDVEFVAREKIAVICAEQRQRALVNEFFSGVRAGKIVLWWMNGSVQRVTGGFTTPTNAGDNNWKVVASGDYGLGAGGLMTSIGGWLGVKAFAPLLKRLGVGG